MEEPEQLAIAADPLLLCCLCKRLLRNAVQLTCLHNCCRQCFRTAASNGCSQVVVCGSCGLNSRAGIEQPNCFVDRQVQQYISIADLRVCGICKGRRGADDLNPFWCPTCCYSLCGDCIAWHRQVNGEHGTQSTEEFESLKAVCSQSLYSVCRIHKKPLDVACLNCEQAKCISCWAECHEKSHKMHVAGSEPFDKYVGEFTRHLFSMEIELLRKSEILDKPRRSLRDTIELHKCHLEKIRQRKRLILDAVEKAYEEIEFATDKAYDEQEANGDAAIAEADRIASALSEARSYIKRLVESDDKCEILNQQKILRERLSVLSTEVDALSKKMAATCRVQSVDPSLPDDLVSVIRHWIGMPVSSLAFVAASASIQMPVNCYDVAMTQDGRLLLAAMQHGLLEFSSSSAQELSRWWPPKLSDDQDDCVATVAALSDRRAAVGVRYAQLVLLVRRCEQVGNNSSSHGTEAAAVWTEELRLDQLPWPPCWLAAHGDVLAMTQSVLVEQQQRKWLPGQRLQLLSLSTGRRLSTERQRNYVIFSLAVSARAVVTASKNQVEPARGGRAVQVLDAHSLAGDDERLWRHELSSSEEDELLLGVCVDSAGGCLYAAVRRRDLSRSRVFALSLIDGSELRHVALSFGSAFPQLLPARLSLSVEPAEQQAGSSKSRRELQLAVLCWDSSSEEWLVTVHSSSRICQQQQQQELPAAAGATSSN